METNNNPEAMVRDIGTMNQAMDNHADNMPMVGGMGYPMVYPEVFYKLQPYIMMLCDRMENYGYMVPTQAMAEQMTDYVYDDICRMYPELAEYARRCEPMEEESQLAVETINGNVGMFDRDRDRDRDRNRFFRPDFRRRGMFRDLIDILFLSELFNRRRRYNYY